MKYGIFQYVRVDKVLNNYYIKNNEFLYYYISVSIYSKIIF